MFSRKRWRRTALFLALVLAVGYAFVVVAAPYGRATTLVVRAAHVGGRAEAVASRLAPRVITRPPHKVPTRSGDVIAQFYEPETSVQRTVLLVPGIHSLGIAEPRLTALAQDLAGAGVRVMAMALPDLVRYRITPQSTDVIEDAVDWMSGQAELAPDRRVGVVGISFAGGLSVVAAGRPRIRDHVAFVVSFGGHGDLPRVMHYLVTGEAPRAEGAEPHPPHDYGVAVILYSLADHGMVPAEQVAALRDGIRTFLLASQLTLVDMKQANARFQEAREIATVLPVPSSTYLHYVNERNVQKLGRALMPYIDALGSDDPALSPERASTPPAAPTFLLHGHADTVIPAAESVLLSQALRAKDVEVHLLLSELITHADVDSSATIADALKLVGFWGGVLAR